MAPRKPEGGPRGPSNAANEARRVVLTHPDRLHVGHISRPHALHGQVKLSTFDHDAPSLQPGVPVELCAADGRVVARHTLRAVTRLPDGILATLDGLATRTAAEAAVGLQVCVPRAALPPLEEGEAWAFSLVGCAVVDEAGRTLGDVVDVQDGTAHDVLSVRTADGAVHEIPLVEALVPSVDVAARRVVVRPIPGLLDSHADDA